MFTKAKQVRKGNIITHQKEIGEFFGEELTLLGVLQASVTQGKGEEHNECIPTDYRSVTKGNDKESKFKRTTKKRRFWGP